MVFIIKESHPFLVEREREREREYKKTVIFPPKPALVGRERERLQEDGLLPAKAHFY